MPITPKQLANLKPKPFTSEYQPANSGKKLGSKNRRTIALEWLTMRSNAVDPEGNNVLLSQQDQIMIAMIERAKKGDTNAAYFVFDSAHGKVPQTVANTEEPASKIDWSKYTTEEIEQLTRLMNKGLIDPNAHIPEAEIVE
jgi:hypothetical protein